MDSKKTFVGVNAVKQLFPNFRTGLDPLSIYDGLELTSVDPERPYVAINMVTSIDGKITLDGGHQVQKLGSPVDRGLMLQLRSHFDAVLRGAGTVRANPSFPGVSPQLAQTRTQRGDAPQPLAVVLSGSLDVPVDGEIFSQRDRVVVFTTESSDPAARDGLRRYAEVEVAGDDAIDVDAMLRRLKERYGVERLLVEGGANVNYAFFAARAVDSLFCTLAPKISGMETDVAMVQGPTLLRPVPSMALRSLFYHEDELFFHWSARR